MKIGYINGLPLDEWTIDEIRSLIHDLECVIEKKEQEEKE
tara:strand:- start:285 stop:404 length:120 start_codon:yes stop_codon:yes gene_type:complete